MPLFNKRCRDYVEDDEAMSQYGTDVDEDMDDMEEPSHWSLICGEPCGYKCIDWNGVSTGVNQLMVLNTIRQGTAGYERVGAAVTIKAVVIIAAYAPGSNLQGIALVYDHQPNGTLPAYGDICATVSNTGAVGSPAYIWLNPKNSARFELLYYEPHLNFNTNSTIMPFILNRRIEMDRPTIFKSSSATPVIGDMVTGGIYLISTSFNTTVNVRVIYEDV